MTAGVYGLFDVKTGDCLYVGQSTNVEQRTKRHLSQLRSGRHKRADFVEWWNANGCSADTIEIRLLTECEQGDQECLNTCEIKWFNTLQPRFYGKLPSSDDKFGHSPEVRTRIAESVRKSYGNESGKAKKEKLLSKKCSFCDKEFYPVVSRVRFCSTSCGAHVNNQIFNSPDKVPTKSSLEELVIREGLSTRQIAKIYGCSHVTIFKYLKKYGIGSTVK